jgi:hypothetical protein
MLRLDLWRQSDAPKPVLPWANGPAVFASPLNCTRHAGRLRWLQRCCVRFTQHENDAAVRLLSTILAWFKRWFGRSVAAEPVPAPVQLKPCANSGASTPNVQPTAPVPTRTTSTPEPVQRLKAKPPAAEQAQALMEFLHREYAGSKVRAVDVKAICYRQLIEAMDWRARPWDGKDGVGVHLGRLTGGRTFAWFTVDGERRRQRAYLIPVAITVRKRA